MHPSNARAELRELLLDALVPAIEVVDAIDGRLAFGREARDHEARRGAQVGRHTVPARQLPTPRTIAALPETSMSAPSRCISRACMKRFSKMVSVITAVPSEIASSAISCACMSVGNPG